MTAETTHEHDVPYLRLDVLLPICWQLNSPHAPIRRRGVDALARLNRPRAANAARDWYTPSTTTSSDRRQLLRSRMRAHLVGLLDLAVMTARHAGAIEVQTVSTVKNDAGIYVGIASRVVVSGVPVATMKRTITPAAAEKAAAQGQGAAQQYVVTDVAYRVRGMVAPGVPVGVADATARRLVISYVERDAGQILLRQVDALPPSPLTRAEVMPALRDNSWL